jgi:hypothetical protein
VSAEAVAVKVWSRKRSADYGSPHINEHALTVSRATLSEDANTVRLEIPEIQPTWCMEIRCQLRGKDGTEFSRTIHNTIHSLAAGNVANKRPQRDN